MQLPMVALLVIYRVAVVRCCAYRFNRFCHFSKKTLIIVDRDICSFIRLSSVGRKTECCVRYTTETVDPTEFNFDMSDVCNCNVYYIIETLIFPSESSNCRN